MNNCAESKIVH